MFEYVVEQRDGCGRIRCRCVVEFCSNQLNGLLIVYQTVGQSIIRDKIVSFKQKNGKYRDS